MTLSTVPRPSLLTVILSTTCDCHVLSGTPPLRVEPFLSANLKNLPSFPICLYMVCFQELFLVFLHTMLGRMIAVSWPPLVEYWSAFLTSNLTLAQSAL